MIEEDDEYKPRPVKDEMPFQNQLMEWGLIVLTISTLAYFFIVIVF